METMPHKDLNPPKHSRVPRLPPSPKPLFVEHNDHEIEFEYAKTVQLFRVCKNCARRKFLNEFRQTENWFGGLKT
ncbi:hypothetical protein Droror1_Dr00022406 [Drosera rotundifolia]